MNIISRQGACVIALAAAALSIAPAAFAQAALPMQRVLTSSLAMQAAVAAERACATQGFSVSVAVTDRSGFVRALLAGDGAADLKTVAAQGKAHAASVFGDNTSGVAKGMPDAQAVLGRLDPGLLVQPGGVPLKISGEIVGAIGVAGAPGGDKDEACAKAAADDLAKKFR